MAENVGAVGGRPRSARRARARQRAEHTITLEDVRRYRHMGVIPASMRPLVRLAEDELAAWVQDLGGPSEVSAQERAVLEDAARLGVILRAQVLRFMRSDGNDRHAATSATTAAATRRASLPAVGLGRRAREIDRAPGPGLRRLRETAVYGTRPDPSLK